MKAYELLADPDKWGRDIHAVDAESNPVQAVDPRAVKFDIIGAIFHCHGSFLNTDKLINKVRRLMRQRYGVERGNLNLEEFNDDPRTTHAEVIALLKEADV